MHTTHGGHHVLKACRMHIIWLHNSLAIMSLGKFVANYTGLLLIHGPIIDDSLTMII